jgi:hypothetical protein
MSHTTNHGGTRFIHNGDYSGEVEIQHSDQEAVWVPFSDLLQFVADYVRQEKIAKLEQASGREVLLGD